MWRRNGGSERYVSVWRLAMWFGVMAGLGQALLVGLARLTTERLILIGADAVWMAPVVNVAIFALAAIPLQLLARRVARSAIVVAALSVFLFLALLGPFLIVPRVHSLAAIVLAAGIAVQGARLAAARERRLEGLVRWTLPAALIVTAALGVVLHVSRDIFASHVEASHPSAQGRPPNVVLVVLDTVRAQNLSLYGYERNTSPRLDAFARTGVVFERALSTSPWTLPSHANLFTGRLPHELSADWLAPLNNAHPTMAEVFAARGYATGGFVANVLYATAETGLGRGFARYKDYPLTAGTFVQSSWLAREMATLLKPVFHVDQLVHKTAADVNEEFLKWLETTPPQTPFFAFLNYFDAHAPYVSPPPFNTRFGSGGPPPNIMVRRSWSPQEIQRSLDAYDSALAYVDDQLGRLVDSLRVQGLLQDTIVAVTSDHGEQFGEHGLFDHGNSLYRPVLQVPLIISFAAKVPQGVRISEPVTLADLPATLLELAGAGTDMRTLPGHSLQPHWTSPHPPAEGGRALIAEVSKAINMPEWLPATKGPMKSVVLGGMHYIRNGDGREELYDFDRDVGEVENLVGRAEARAALERSRRALAGLLNP
jgi:arylsulfatase A-like enzyme